MKKIFFKQIKIKDFKGIADKTVDLSEARNIFKGSNGLGKTSIAEAITFTLFSKGINAEKISNEPIVNGQIKQNYLQVLELTMMVDDKEYIITKTVFKNQIIEMTINKKKIELVKAWNSRLEEIFGVNQDEFWILSNPKYLSSLPNKVAREFILTLTSRISDRQIIDDYQILNELSDEKLQLMRENVEGGIFLDQQLQLKREDIAILEKEIEKIDIKLESKKETLAKITNVKILDYSKLEKNRTQLKSQVTKNTKHNEKIDSQIVEKQKLEYELKNLESKISKEVNFTEELNKLNFSLKKARKDYDKVNGQPLKEFAKECNTCGKPMEDAEFVMGFKVNALKTINEKGKKISAEIAKIKAQQDTWADEIELDKNRLEIVKTKISQLSFNNKKIDNSKLMLQIEEITNHIGSYEAIQKINEEIEELRQSRKEKSLLLDAEQASELLLADVFSKKVDSVSAKINKKLKKISVELFDTKKNGNIKEIFTISDKGIAYSMFNNAKQINSGIEMINFIQKEKKVSLPIFIDNAESVNELEKTNSQTIELNVSNKKELEITYG